MTLDALFAENESKRALERAWLLYTPVWGAVAGVVMLTGLAERWGDVELLAFGIALAAGTWAAALLSSPASERATVPLFRRTAFKAALAITAFALGLNYLQTPFFFDVLHMRYGFAATWTIERNPVFLYLVTVAYFATYSVLACMGMRWALRWRPSSRAWRVLATFLVAAVLAFLETALNANPWMTRLFCYGEPAMMYSFGTGVYALALALAIPGWMWLDESPRARMPLLGALAWVAVALCVDTAACAGIRAWVAPLVTTVEDPSAPGWDARGCLAP